MIIRMSDCATVRLRLRWGGLMLLFMTAAATSDPAPISSDADRAGLLYDTYCVGCHTSIAHRRADPRARSPEEVAIYVRRWSSEQKLGWSEQDISDVTDLLVRRYYRFAAKLPDRNPPPR
jgi:hypothetical protein